MMRRTFAFHGLMAVAISICTSSASAAITVYNSEPAFVAAIAFPGVDNFTGFSITSSTASPIIRSAGPYGYTGTASTSTFFGAGTSVNPWLATNVAVATITFNGFSAGVSGVGGLFFGSNVSGAFLSGDIQVVAVDGDGATSTQTIVGATTSSFLGFVSDGDMSSLTVTSIQPPSGSLWPTVDNLTLGVGQSLVDAVFVDSFE